MSTNEKGEGFAAMRVADPPVEPTNGHVQVVAAPEPEFVKVKLGRPRWLASASVGVVALIATGTLGYTSYATSQQRDATHRQPAATPVTLTAAQADAAKRKLT